MNARSPGSILRLSVSLPVSGIAHNSALRDAGRATARQRGAGALSEGGGSRFRFRFRVAGARARNFACCLPTTMSMQDESKAPHVSGTFDHDRLPVYRLALELHALVCRLVPRRGCHIVRDQIERSSLGVVLCIAEGAGRSSAPDKRRFYSMARGTATESAALLDVLAGRRLLPIEGTRQGRALLLSIVRMLTRLCGVPSSPAPEPEPAP